MLCLLGQLTHRYTQQQFHNREGTPLIPIPSLPVSHSPCFFFFFICFYLCQLCLWQSSTTTTAWSELCDDMTSNWLSQQLPERTKLNKTQLFYVQSRSNSDAALSRVPQGVTQQCETWAGTVNLDMSSLNPPPCWNVICSPQWANSSVNRWNNITQAGLCVGLHVLNI